MNKSINNVISMETASPNTLNDVLNQIDTIKASYKANVQHILCVLVDLGEYCTSEFMLESSCKLNRLFFGKAERWLRVDFVCNKTRLTVSPVGSVLHSRIKLHQNKHLNEENRGLATYIGCEGEPPG